LKEKTSQWIGFSDQTEEKIGYGKERIGKAEEKIGRAKEK